MRHGLEWVCVLGGLLTVGLTEGRPPAPGKASPAIDKATLGKVRKLQEKRRDVLREAVDLREKQIRAGGATLDGVGEMTKRLLAAELELATTDAEVIAAHHRHFEKARKLFEWVKASHQAGVVGRGDLLEVQAVLLEAEIGFLKAGGKPRKVKE